MGLNIQKLIKINSLETGAVIRNMYYTFTKHSPHSRKEPILDTKGDNLCFTTWKFYLFIFMKKYYK